MEQTRTQRFQAQQRTLAVVAKALAHPARIAILQMLMRAGRCVCGELVEGLPLAQATVSQHLKVLKYAGLIKGEIEPHRSCYCIDPQGWARARELMGGFLMAYEPEGSDTGCC